MDIVFVILFLIYFLNFKFKDQISELTFFFIFCVQYSSQLDFLFNCGSTNEVIYTYIFYYFSYKILNKISGNVQ